MKYPECTHCKYEFDNEEMWYGPTKGDRVSVGDCDQSELVCPSCDKTFHVRCGHSYTFVNVDEDGEEL